MATLIFFFMMKEATPCRPRWSMRSERNEGDRDRTHRADCERVERGGEAAAQGAFPDALGGISSPGGDAVAGRVTVLRREAAPGRGQGAFRRGRHPGPGRAEP